MFTLDSNDATPLYQQLFQQIKEQILSGKLSAHFRLPSIRELATELATSRNTVEGAFLELCAEGYIYSKSRSGYFVSDIDRELANSSQLTRQKQDLHPKLAEHYLYDFHPARLDPAIFPTTAWRACVFEALRSSSDDFSQYSEPQGEWGLRCNIQFYLERSRGVLCSPDQIVICSGLQQGLDIVAQLIRTNHNSVAVENPGYPLPRDVFGNHGFNISPVNIDSSGIKLNALKASSSTVVYITPSHQMPLGHVMPVSNRLNLISWAKEVNGIIIEDDYDSELRYLGRPIASLQGLCSDGNIVYQGTFSKVFSPALRLSYMVLPKPLLGTYIQKFQNYLSPVPLLTQRAMITFMERGHWDQHLRRSRIFYKKKHAAILQAIKQNFGSKAEVVGQGAGLHIVVELAKSISNEAKFIDKAKQHGVRLLPFSAFYASGEPKNNRLLIGFGGPPVDKICQGIKVLSKLID